MKIERKIKVKSTPCKAVLVMRTAELPHVVDNRYFAVLLAQVSAGYVGRVF